MLQLRHILSSLASAVHAEWSARAQAQDRIMQVSMTFATLLLAVGGFTSFAHQPRAENVLIWCALFHLPP